MALFYFKKINTMDIFEFFQIFELAESSRVTCGGFGRVLDIVCCKKNTYNYILHITILILYLLVKCAECSLFNVLCIYCVINRTHVKKCYVFLSYLI